MNFTQIEQTLGVGDIMRGLGCSQDNVADCLPSGSTLIAAGGSLALGYTLFEQARFKWYRRTKDKGELPGRWGAAERR